MSQPITPLASIFPLPLGEGQGEGAKPRSTTEQPALAPAWHHSALTLTASAPFHGVFAPEVLLPSLLRLCAQSSHVVEGHTLHRFEPQGASLFLHGPRLRLALHTWPERGLATLDVACADADADALVDAVCLALALRVSERHRVCPSERDGGAE
ncbi:MAG: S-adenosylmethionine decarboxylase [Myxococcaceae bacterium]|nr:S-adenosylmethionine decarboxylase [Myxococcaceae bacterium]